MKPEISGGNTHKLKKGLIGRIMSRFARISVKWKLFSFLAIFVAFVIALLWIMQVLFLDNFYKYIKTKEIKDTASVIRQNIDVESEEMDEKIKQLSSSKSMSILVIKTNGEVLYNSENKIMDPLFTMIYNNLKSIVEQVRSMDGEYIQYANIVNFSNEEPEMGYRGQANGQGTVTQVRRLPQNIFYAGLMEMQDESEVLVILNSNITPVDSTVQTIQSQLIIITIILLLFALLLALVISTMISKPIMHMNETSKKLAKGDYKVVFKGGGYREIIELSETLNYAAGELAKVDDYRRELIANVSHDLRTPLTLISGYSEAMRDLPGENTKENIDIIANETKRLTTLVNDVLDLSKYEAFGLEGDALNLTKFNLTQSVHEMVECVSAMIAHEGYKIDFLYSEECFTNADEIKISRGLYNLLGNAITYTGVDKKVTVTQKVNLVMKEDGSYLQYVRISVTDTGAGIPKDKLKNIWERYYKANNEHRRPQVGTGLGLSIVKSIFDMHKIRYGVISEKEEGSTFWFELEMAK